MNKEIAERVKELADYIVSTKKTIRETAKIFKISKSTVHKDISERLKELDFNKYIKVEDIFKEHIEIRHILGGQSTKIKYQQIKNNSGG